METDLTDLKKLANMANQIQADVSNLENALREAESAGLTYDRFSGFLDFLQAEFDEFSLLVKTIPDSDRRTEIKEKIATCYNQFYRMRQSALALPSPVNEYDEIPNSEDPLDSEDEDEPDEPEDLTNDFLEQAYDPSPIPYHPRKKRTLRKPQLPEPFSEPDNQSQSQRELEILREYRERQHESEAFEHLDSRHLDLSHPLNSYTPQGVPFGHPSDSIPDTSSTGATQDTSKHSSNLNDPKIRKEAAQWLAEQQHHAVSDHAAAPVSTRVSQGVPFGHPEKIQQAIEQNQNLGPAIDLVIHSRQVSFEHIKKELHLGFAQTARVIDEMQQIGILEKGPADHSYRIMVTQQEWEPLHNGRHPPVSAEGVPSGHPSAPIPDASSTGTTQDTSKHSSNLNDPKIRKEAAQWLTEQQQHAASDHAASPVSTHVSQGVPFGHPSQYQQSDEHPPVPKIQTTGLPTTAQRVVNTAITPPIHRFTLSSLENRLGGFSYMIYSRTMQELVQKSGNDTMRAISSAAYYSQIAQASIGILAYRPATKSMLCSASQITPDQLKADMRRTLQEKKYLQTSNSALRNQLANPNLSDVRRTALQRQLIENSLRQTTPAMVQAEQIRKFIHEKAMDQEIVQALTKNGKIVTRNKAIRELGGGLITAKGKALQKQYGNLSLKTDRQVKAEISRLQKAGRDTKRQLLALQRKPGLSQEDRQTLLRLKKRLQSIGQQIRTRYSYLTDRSDLVYQQFRVQKLIAASNNQRQRIRSLSSFTRSMLLRPVFSSEQTEGFAREIQILTDRRLHRAAGKMISLPAKTVQKAGRLMAPELSNRIHYAVDAKKAAIHSQISQTQKSVQKAVANSVPAGIRTNTVSAGQKIRSVKETMRLRTKAVKTQFANSRIGRFTSKVHLKAKAAQQTITHGTALVKKLLLKIVAGYLIFMALMMILSSALSSLSTGAFGNSVIISPEPSSSGKINLQPYMQILREESSQYQQAASEQLLYWEEQDRLADGTRIERVTCENFGGFSNDREILSMMAIRFNQDLDLRSNPEIETFLRDMHHASHILRIDRHSYRHSDPSVCPHPELHMIPPDPTESSPTVSPDASEPTIETEPRYELRCPGHMDVKITSSVTKDLSSLFALDTRSYAGNPDWAGWTEENIQAANLIFSMPWGELYEGFTGGSAIGTIVPGEQEAYIWQALNAMTGNSLGAAALMGNLYAESGLLSTNLQDSYEAVLGFDDAGYTAAVDSGIYPNFSTDSAGYGLAQWTYSSRKASLLNYARSIGSSIGDLGMQLQFLQSELEGTPVMQALKTATSIRDASDVVLTEYEKPYDQSQGVKDIRASYGQYFYNKYVKGIESEGDLTAAQLNVIRIATNSAGYGIPAEAGMCQAWAASVYEAAGLPVDHSPSAYHSGMRYGVSSDFSIIPPGAAIYGYSNSRFGHVGIYVGNGLVYHNIGGVAVDTLEDWISIYRGFCWGWQAGTDLTQLE